MDRRDNRSSPQGETATIVVEFLEVAISSIVFLKEFYPSGAFERRKYMNLVVQRARHPQLRDYIHSSVSGLLPFIQKDVHTQYSIVFDSLNFEPIFCTASSKLRKHVSDVLWWGIVEQTVGKLPKAGLVEKVAVIFFNSENIPIERFIFKLVVNQSYGSKLEDSDLEFSLKSFLIKLSVSKPLTKTLPNDCRWEITAYFSALPETGTSKDAESWIPTVTKQWLQPSLIKPIKSLSTDPLNLQLYLEHPSLSEKIP